jgi:hypothetical protein
VVFLTALAAEGLRGERGALPDHAAVVMSENGVLS